MKCTLPISVNTCPHFNKENNKCQNPLPCSFKELIEEAKENTAHTYERKERWYEQYYK